MPEVAVKIFNIKSETPKRCDKCHRPSKSLYRVNIGGMTYNICSMGEVRDAIANFKAKKDIQFNPDQEIIEELMDTGELT